MKTEPMSNEEMTLYRLGKVETQLEEMKAMLAKVHDTVIATQNCPAPGLCIQLQASLVSHSERLMALERWQAKLIGALAIIIPLSGILGPKVSELLFK